MFRGMPQHRRLYNNTHASQCTCSQLYGETGAQSSILHAFDAALGIEHEQVGHRGRD